MSDSTQKPVHDRKASELAHTADPAPKEDQERAEAVMRTETSSEEAPATPSGGDVTPSGGDGGTPSAARSQTTRSSGGR